MNTFSILSSQLGKVVLSVIVASVFSYFWLREHRSLLVRVEEPVVIASVGSEKIDELSLYYKEKKIESFSVVVVAIENTGNSHLRSEDFSRPLQLSFKGDMISKPVLLKSNPEQLDPILTVVGDATVELRPLLLNQGDVIEFRVGVVNLSDALDPVRINGRIAGVEKIASFVKKKDAKFIIIPYWCAPFLLLVLTYIGFCALFFIVSVCKRMFVQKAIP